MSPTHEEIVAVLEVFESEIGTSDRKWARSFVIEMLKAAERARSHFMLSEPKMCPSADE